MTDRSHILTLISDPKERCIDDTALHLLRHHFDRPLNMIPLAEKTAYDVAITADEAISMRALSRHFHELRIDIAIQKRVRHRRKAALIADMDSTMIEQECIDELADTLGIKEPIARITESAMRGEIEFDAALRERVRLLAGLPVSIIQDVIDTRITLRSGGRELVQTMRTHGAYTALVSGGFTLFAQHIANALGFHENRANQLELENDRLSGEVSNPVLGPREKMLALEEISQVQLIDRKDILAIGDGANDLCMLERAGLGVAIHAKQKVAKAADLSINFGDLTALLYIQGYNQSDIVA